MRLLTIVFVLFASTSTLAAGKVESKVDVQLISHPAYGNIIERFTRAEIYIGPEKNIAVLVLVGADRDVCEISTEHLKQLNSSAIELVDYLNSAKSRIRLSCTRRVSDGYSTRYALTKMVPN